MWPVEIYSKEFLDAHPLAQLRLQYNADSAKYKSSFGDDMAVIYKAWSTTSEQAKLNLLSSKKDFVKFLNRFLPSNTSLASWLPLLKHAEWMASTPSIHSTSKTSKYYEPHLSSDLLRRDKPNHRLQTLRPRPYKNHQRGPSQSN